MFFKKKNQEPEPVWELEEEYQRQKAILARQDIGWTMETYDQQLQTVLKLEERKRKWEAEHKPPEKRRISPDGWLAAAVTAIVGVAPYAIEKGGHLANHLKGRIQTPDIWKFKK